jgi:hypothetical protein
MLSTEEPQALKKPEPEPGENILNLVAEVFGEQKIGSSS